MDAHLQYAILTGQTSTKTSRKCCGFCIDHTARSWHGRCYDRCDDRDAGGDDVKPRRIARLVLVGLLTHGSGVCAESVETHAKGRAEAHTKTLDVKMSGSTAMAPATLRGLVMIESHPANRLLRVTIDGENLFQSSDIQLEGAEAPHSHFISWRDIPAGEYVVTAVLYEATGERTTLVRRFVVIGH
jgi:hypothetical protein